MKDGFRAVEYSGWSWGPMNLPFTKLLIGGIAGAVSMVLVCGAALFTSPTANRAPQANELAKISIDYPLNGSVFPPEITPPTFLWHDSNETAHRWVVEVKFVNPADAMRIQTAGEHLQRGKLDPDAGPGLELTPEQSSTRTWKPDAEMWGKIKRLSAKSPAIIRITGFADGDGREPVSGGSVTITTSVDPVGAPVFYRDVPLLTTPAGEKGPIQPLPHAAIPLIKWQVRDIGEPRAMW